MKRFLVIILIGFFSGPCNAMVAATHLPNLKFFNLTPEISTVYYGEQVVLNIQMLYAYLKTHQEWRFPANIQPQDAVGICPPFTNRRIYIKAGLCTFNLVIKGEQLGKVINGDSLYYLYDDESGRSDWGDFHFSITVIPHPLSMANLPLQKATANLPLYFDLRRYVNYFEENSEAGSQPIVDVFPQRLDGLHYDPKRFALVGTPSRTGSYQFTITVKNDFSHSAPAQLYFDVGVNLSNKPIFKKIHQIASAMPGQQYQLNLMELIEHRASFSLSNPVHFRIDINQSHPDWLRIGGQGDIFLQGPVPVSEAGTTRELTIIASSNTGGDSEPLKLQLPIATDPASRPHISSFSLKKSAGTSFEYDVRKHITDPAADASLQLIIDNVEPEISWLSVSPSNPTTLFGFIPDNAAGQQYQLRMHANTTIGGNSDLIEIPLAIDFDQEKRPRFKAVKPQLPLIYPGVPYEHDFVLNRDIYPDYEDEAYLIELAEGYNNPPWLLVENNRLIANTVPEALEQVYAIYLTIKNKPGGKSDVIPLMLVAMI